jgi:hypothetical protein
MKTSKIQNTNSKILAVKPTAYSAVNGDRVNTVCGGFLFVRSEMESVDWHYYSKAWHRAHGPKRTTSERKVAIYKYNGRAKEKLQVAATVEFDGWRGKVTRNK